MKSISFFSPVYIVDTEIETAEAEKLCELTPLTYFQNVINFAEYVFAFSKGYGVETTAKDCNPMIAKRYKHADETQHEKWVKAAVITAVFVCAFVFYPVLLLPAAMFAIKVINYISHPPLKMKKVINGGNRSDKDIAHRNFLDELELLQIGGRKFNKFRAEIKKVNEEKNSAKAGALYKTFSFFQNHCKETLKNPEYSESIDIINNAIDALTVLKSSFKSVIKGIPNVGNSCYMNSAMQALLAMPYMSEKILAIDVAEVAHRQKKLLEALQNFIKAYGSTLISKHEMVPIAQALREAFYDAGDIDISPEKFEIEDHIKNFLANEGDEDLLEDLRLHLKSLVNKDLMIQNDAIRIVDSILSLIRFNMPRIELKSPNEDNLETLRITAVPTLYLPLPMEAVLAQKKLHLNDFIADYFKIDDAGDKENQLNLQNVLTGELQASSSWQEQTFFEGNPPPFIPVLLNRLTPSIKFGSYVEDGELNRVSVQCEPDDEYDFSNYFEKAPLEGALYRISAVIRQSGISGSSGHYTSIKRDVHNPKLWNYCNDSRTSPISGHELKEELSQGYIFFLERIKFVSDSEENLPDDAKVTLVRNDI